jgi:hypothetical protein
LLNNLSEFIISSNEPDSFILLRIEYIDFIEAEISIEGILTRSTPHSIQSLRLNSFILYGKPAAILIGPLISFLRSLI